MSSEKLRNDIIRTRDRRQALLGRHLAVGYPATLFLSLNIPGAIKNPPGAAKLFSWALGRLAEALPGLAVLETSIDLLGPYAVLGINQSVDDVKRRCMALETSQPAARLVDLDVYDSHGRQIDRAALSLPPRPCLICDRTAVECIRLGRHFDSNLMEKTDELLAPFRD
jgi:holo-ACP synthase